MGLSEVIVTAEPDVTSAIESVALTRLTVVLVPLMVPVPTCR